MDYRVLLYYKYVPIEDPETFTQEHLKFCKELGLKGRIHIAHEGINGTVSGTVEQTNLYMDTLRKDPALVIWYLKLMKLKAMRLKRCMSAIERKLLASV